jgi:predicted alpha/beta-hydrolase family hydrolase
MAGEALAEDAPALVLGHGAGAGKDHPWMIRVAEGLEARGIRVVTFNFPYMDAGKSVPDPPAVLEAAFAKVWKDAASKGRMFAGGKSMGGRIASQVAAKHGFDPAPAGLVFFGYPLHPPGKPAQRRDKHLPDITAPMLFLHGTRDPFGSPEEMGELVKSVPNARLEIVEGGDHSLAAPKRQDPGGGSLNRAIAFAAAFVLSP